MIKELKNNGCRFMCNCKASGLSVFDMDVEDNVEKIEFSGIEYPGTSAKREPIKAYFYYACGCISRMPAGIRIFLHIFSPSSSNKNMKKKCEKTSKKFFILHINLDGKKPSAKQEAIG